MKFPIASTLAFAGLAQAWYKGLNIGGNLPNGACRSQADFLRAFNTMKSLPPQFNVARLFASSDCNTLLNAVPAALQAGVRLLPGIWTQDDAHYGREKQAMLDAIAAHPNWLDWMVGVSVGSEDLYRKEVPASSIASKIYDVRGMLRSKGVTSWVGHVDTWNAWTDPANTEVIKACDWIGTDQYPYWQGATIQQAPGVFWAAVDAVRNRVRDVKPNTPIWVTETGWAVAGKSFGASTASIPNAQAFWRNTACPAFPQIDVFYYAYSEQGSDPDFSILDGNDRPLFDLSC
ncbi:putative glucan 1,3-beta-glucosidase [Microthyrium microscopicum]|uniref:Probable glucan endo-1,3-beta-glucosidase eglC n=1 Tax=Microthyrium microscopicum TaxID=703497 RepID=A0A6A6TV87_9PEZI|nr:putative glucan 1,3-beta-glucosidase [Microthyrium microscopicum]